MPHCPFIAPRELFDHYFELVDVPQQSPEELEREPEAIKNYKKLRGLVEPLSEHQIRVARAAYFGMCEFLDQQIGRILRKLDETGLSENTLVIYTSDHGEMAGEHGCWWKSTYFEGSVGIPMVARLPGVVPEGDRNPVFCSLMDLGPTMVEMAGAKQMPDMDGRSLWTELRGQKDESRTDEVVSEFCSTWGDPPSRMVRQGPWKLYKYHDDSPPVLYNMDEDPEEMNDLGADPDYETVRSELLKRLYEDWDPEYVERESAALDRDMELLKRWGEVVQPQHEDAAIIPDVEDIELR